MGELGITNASYGNLTNTGTNYSVSAINTDGTGDNKETEWQNTEWSQQLGYYKTIPELQIAIDAKATWTIGKGYKADNETTFILQGINGTGKDTFNTILENAVRTYNIGGDTFIEIIKNEDGMLINLKPLDPATIKIIANDKGKIIRYEQVSKIHGKTIVKFKPEEIFHLSRKRLADEIHGISLIKSVENIILARNEAMADMKTVMHRYAKPRIVFKLDTDDSAKIEAFKVKADYASDKAENIFIPMGTVEYEILSVPANSSMSHLPMIQALNQYFFQACGVPQIIVGGSQEMTEATAKIAYLAFEQTIEEEQLYLEEQVGMQLGLKVELEFPASLKNDVITGMSKEESMKASTPEDTTLTGAI